MDNNNNLVELEDGYSKTENSSIKKGNAFSLNIASLLLIVGFVVMIAMTFYKNISDTSINRDAILLRQVELLNILKTSQNDQEMEYVVQEYDSLARVIQAIDN